MVQVASCSKHVIMSSGQRLRELPIRFHILLGLGMLWLAALVGVLTWNKEPVVEDCWLVSFEMSSTLNVVQRYAVISHSPLSAIANAVSRYRFIHNAGAQLRSSNVMLKKDAVHRGVLTLAEIENKFETTCW